MMLGGLHSHRPRTVALPWPSAACAACSAHKPALPRGCLADAVRMDVIHAIFPKKKQGSLDHHATITLRVERRNLLGTSLHQLQRQEPHMLARRPLCLKFKGEEVSTKRLWSALWLTATSILPEGVRNENGASSARGPPSSSLPPLGRMESLEHKRASSSGSPRAPARPTALPPNGTRLACAPASTAHPTAPHPPAPAQLLPLHTCRALGQAS